MRLWNVGWGSFAGEEKRIREEGGFLQWFFGETATRTTSEGKDLQGPLGEREL
jgi:hypothetical protein